MSYHVMFFISGIMILFLSPISEAQIITFEQYYGGQDSDYGSYVEQTPDGGYIICGSWKVSDIDRQGYIIRTNSVGDKLWSKGFDPFFR